MIESNGARCAPYEMVDSNVGCAPRTIKQHNKKIPRDCGGLISLSRRSVYAVYHADGCGTALAVTDATLLHDIAVVDGLLGGAEVTTV